MKKYVMICASLFSMYNLSALVPGTKVVFSDSIKKCEESPSLEQVSYVKFDLDGHDYVFFKTTSKTPHEFIIHAPSCVCKQDARGKAP